MNGKGSGGSIYDTIIDHELKKKKKKAKPPVDKTGRAKNRYESEDVWEAPEKNGVEKYLKNV